MTHLSDESVIEMATGEGRDGDAAHAAACADCERRVRESRETLALLQRAEMPEPSPFYWEALRSGVRERIADEKKRVSAWTLLPPLAAAAALTFLLWGGGAKPPAAIAPSLPAWSPLPAAEEDEGLRVLEGLALTAYADAEWDEPEGLSAYVADLSDEDSRTLADTLRRRAEGGES
jgi:hypothetical protein